ATAAQLNRGQRLTEILKQPQYDPMPIEQQVLIIWAATNGYVDDLPIESVKKFEGGLIDFLQNTRGSLLQKILEKKILDDDLKAEMRAAVTEFKERFTAEGAAGASSPRPQASQPVAAAD